MPLHSTTASPPKSPPPPVSDAAEIDRLREHLQGIAFRLYRHFPFWGLLLEHCSVSVVEDDSVPTACIDRKGNIRFNARFLRSLSNDQATFVLAHEVAHAAFSHFERRRGRDPMLWNIANDYVINLVLFDLFGNASFLPDAVLLDPRFVGMSSEQVYDRIASGESLMSGCPLHGDMTVGDTAAGAAGGAVVLRECRAGHSGDEKAWDHSVVLAHGRARQYGSMPESLDRMIHAKLESRIDWRQELRQYLRGTASRLRPEDYTFLPPSRRWLHRGIYLPSTCGADGIRIAFAVDTSGSMDKEDLAQAVAEIEAIRRQYQGSIYLIECDAEVHRGRWLSPMEPCPETFKGGGGTDFRPVFRHLEDEGIRVDLLVYLTDGEGEYGMPPPLDVLWVTTTERKPPFGMHLRIGDG